MRYQNYGLFTGILVSKEKNLNNADIKRPVADIEIVSVECTPPFCKIPVLFSGETLSKICTAASIGEFLVVFGELREDKEKGPYIEAETVTRLNPKSTDLRKTIIPRFELLNLPQRFNLVSLTGTYHENNLHIKRYPLSKGDLKSEDIIPIYSEEPIENGKDVSIAGELIERNGKIMLHAKEISQKGDK